MKKQKHSRWIFILGMLFFCISFYAQEIPVINRSTDSVVLQVTDSIIVGHPGPDLNYREDQFYIGLNFNLLTNLPKHAGQSGFSGGLSAGFIRDIPLNKRRNFGVGIGLGWSFDSYRSNILISKNEVGSALFQVLRRGEYDYHVNRFNTYLVEMPIQLRWRTSTAESYKFWRIYAGLRVGYMYYFDAKFKQRDQKIHLNGVPGLDRIRYGATFAFGYNTFNFSLYYSLNPFFKNSYTTEDEPVDFTTFKIGLEFYLF